jgi:hypothetical protein
MREIHVALQSQDSNRFLDTRIFRQAPHLEIHLTANAPEHASVGKGMRKQNCRQHLMELMPPPRIDPGDRLRVAQLSWLAWYNHVLAQLGGEGHVNTLLRAVDQLALQMPLQQKIVILDNTGVRTSCKRPISEALIDVAYRSQRTIVPAIMKPLIV